MRFAVLLLALAACGGATESKVETKEETKPKAEVTVEKKNDMPAKKADFAAAPADVAAPPADATKTASGLAYKKISGEGSGDHPVAASQVTVHYTGWTTDGKMFDSSKKRGKPATFPLKGVIKGWTEGLQLMKKGETTRFWIPENLAYGGKPGKPPGMLVFDVELLSFNSPKPPPAAPDDVAKPPTSAKVTNSGLAYKVLKEGTGVSPKANQVVQVHYTGWTTDGKAFDSSVSRGQPAEFNLSRVIPGWTEGLQTMKEGGSSRFWIPESLAYRGKPGAPAGMLVFDVELIKVHVNRADGQLH